MKKSILLLALFSFLAPAANALAVRPDLPKIPVVKPYEPRPTRTVTIMPAGTMTGASTLDFKTLQKFVPEEPRQLTSAEMQALFVEMKELNKIPRTELAKLIPRVQYIQYTFEFSANREAREKEIRSYLIFSTRAIAVDPSADSKMYFHNVYELFKVDFDRVMTKLSPRQRSELYAASEEAERLLANSSQDNGDD